MTRPALLSANAVSKSYKRKRVLADVSFAVNRGEVVAVTGENGCGKSTLLKLCARLIAPDTGSVTVNGTLGYCPQDPGLLTRLTINEHLSAFGTGVGMGAASAVKRGRNLLEQLGVEATENSQVGTLSGGTRQKVNLAISLIEDPAVLLLDEPYQGFDLGTYVNFWDLVDGWRHAGKAVVVITHLLTEASRADRLVVMQPLRLGSNIASESFQ